MSDIATAPQPSGLLADQDHPPIRPSGPDPSKLMTNLEDCHFQIQIGSHVVTLVMPAQTLPEWVVTAAQQLNRISELRANWDSYGARPIPQNTLEFAFKKIVDLRNEYPDLRIPLIGAAVTGGIELEWHEEGIDLELHIEAPDHMSAYADDEAADREWEGPVSSNLREIEDFLMRCIG